MTENPCNTSRQLIDWATAEFEKHDLHYGHGTDNPLDEAAFIVLRGLGLPFDADEDQLDMDVDAENRKKIITLVNQRIQTRKPAAYLLNEAWFAGLPFYVNEHVLVPRSPFAELITEQFIPWCDPGQVKSILDVGTGSGCIAIASAFAFPGANVDAIDVSMDALDVARKNVEHYQLQDRVRLIQSDLFEQLQGRHYDLIIANPPYVDAQDMAMLPPEFRHEPALGLEAGVDGLQIVKRILHSAADFMTAQGVIAVEVGNSQHALMEQCPEYPFVWLEFERGGEGVFILTREELQRAGAQT